MRRRLSVVLPILLMTIALFRPTVFFAQTKKPDEQKPGWEFQPARLGVTHRDAP